MEVPQTLIAAIRYFENKEHCRQFMIATRWDDGIVRCPTCDSTNVKYMEKWDRYICANKHEKRQFSLKVGTIFEDSPIGLDKWLPAAWLITNCKNGISSYEIARALGITQKAAWHVLHRLRHAMTETGLQIGANGPVEADETFVGGKLKNMHKDKRAKNKGKLHGMNKTVVLGMLERGGKVRAGVIEDRKLPNLRPMIEETLLPGTHLITDEFVNYAVVAKDNDYIHEVIDHCESYVRGHVHTNGIENFWALLKRTISGSYVSVDAAHLNSYVAEQVFRFNHREDCNDAGRFIQVMSQIVGKRLTYAELCARQRTN